MAELTLLLLLLSATALAVAWPLLDREARPQASAASDEERAARHRLALEALRDLEADRRSGSLDEESYLAQRAEAEARAAQTLPGGPEAEGPSTPAATGIWRGRRVAAIIGAAVIGLVLVGFALPAPFGIAERTVIDQPLADAMAAEEARQAEIGRLLVQLQADSHDTEAWSALADAYLAGPSTSDRQQAALALQALIRLDAQDASAYRRLITLYIETASWRDARAALDAYEGIAAADDPDIPFFRGLIALRGDSDEAEAVRQFDRFLELAPHDPRAAMVVSLREEAAGTSPAR
jgi:cytochrome c-type biogenesis protein CcmI